MIRIAPAGFKNSVGLMLLLSACGLAWLAGNNTAYAKGKIASYAFDVEPGDPPGTLEKLKLAASLAAKGPNCAEVIDATYVPPSQRFPGHTNEPYFVQCTKKHSSMPDAAYGVYFTDADLKAGHVKSQQKPISEHHAIVLCEAAIKRKLRYPSSFELSDFSGGGVSNNGTTNREVKLPFTALNGLGKPDPQWGKCIVVNSRWAHRRDTAQSIAATDKDICRVLFTANKSLQPTA